MSHSSTARAAHKAVGAHDPTAFLTHVIETHPGIAALVAALTLIVIAFGVRRLWPTHLYEMGYVVRMKGKRLVQNVSHDFPTPDVPQPVIAAEDHHAAALLHDDHIYVNRSIRFGGARKALDTATTALTRAPDGRVPPSAAKISRWWS